MQSAQPASSHSIRFVNAVVLRREADRQNLTGWLVTDEPTNHVRVGREVSGDQIVSTAGELIRMFHLSPQLINFDAPTIDGGAVTLSGPSVPVVQAPAIEVIAAPAKPIRPEPVRGKTIDLIGQLRSEADLQAARDAGFAPAETLYSRSTMVLQLGVENAYQARADYDAMPLVRDYCSDLVQIVRSEDRRDVPVYIRDLRMDRDGSLVTIDGAGEVTTRHLVQERTFGALLTRLDIGCGGEYLRRCCPPELRAININEMSRHLGGLEDRTMPEAEKAYREAMATWKRASTWSRGPEPVKPEFSKLVMRTRRSTMPDARDVYGIVSGKYQSFDIDKIAQSISDATPSDARGTFTYDGYRMRSEILFHTTTQPEHFVSGEFFRAGVVVSTDDTGSGAIRVQAVVFQNLCLNLIVIDQGEQDVCTIRHVGRDGRLVAEFRKGFELALRKIDHFVRQWDYACEDRITPSSVVAVKGHAVPTLSEELIAGVFNGILRQELVPVRGNKDRVVAQLVEQWKADDSGAGRAHDGMNRAAVTNAFTAYAHQEAAKVDPWIEEDIQQAAGALLWPASGGRGKAAAVKPAPLPYVQWTGLK